MITKIKESLKGINYRLFLTLLIVGLVPTIYTTIRIFLIGQLPGDWGFNIASQLSWVNIFYEVIQEALILPLYFFIGAMILKKDELANRIKTGMLFTFGIYLLFSIGLMISVEPLLNFMSQDSDLINETATYIRLETIALLFSTLVKFIIVVLVTMKKDKLMYILLGIQMVLTIVFDIFFVSTLNVSLNLGVNGIAITNIIVNTILFITALLMLNRSINLFNKTQLNFSWIKQLIKVGGISGLESLVRNTAFTLMIVRMVNVVGEQGTYWVTTSFLWGWLLLPIMQLGELIKGDVSQEVEDENEAKENSKKVISKNTLGYFAITAGICLIWIVSIPLWKPFMEHVLQIANYQEVIQLVLISLVFYIIFAFNNVIDNIFYGIGKTKYMLFQSLIINTIYYGTAFILYLTGLYEPTLIKITLMFSIGMALDSILTYAMFYWMCKKDGISIVKQN